MSQITRCPSCATMFKVVADQLRISDGWVRCGHCKQVFDASAHLLPPEPAPLMPDLALDKLRPPPQPVPRSDPPARSWGTLPMPPDAMAPTQMAPSQESVHQEDSAPIEPQPLPRVMSVPEPMVPAFLAAPGQPVPDSTADDLPPLALVPETPFPWRRPDAALVQEALSQDVTDLPHHGSDKVIEWPPIDFAPPAAGYELPSPMLEEADPRDLLEPAAEPQALAGEERPSGNDTPEPAEAPEEAEHSRAEVSEPDGPIPVPAPAEAAESVDQVPQEPQTVAGTDPENGAATLHEEAGGDTLADEPSFVRAARRQAFWRRPLVRTGLALLAMALLLGLLFQVAVQERQYIAAQVPQARAVLETLCGPLRCEVGPYRQIAAVVVDGSSFQKLKGDEFQFSLTLRNRAEHAVETPAVELTLTDAQEQPVLRRVLRPQELTAPTELQADAEWSVALPVHIAPGGARITGYRVLVFYP